MSTPDLGAAAPEGEAGLIGSILVMAGDTGRQSEALDACAASLTPDSFSAPAYRATWNAICSCRRSGTPIDLLTIETELRRTGVMERIGGPASIEGAVDKITTPSIWHACLVSILAAWRARQAAEIGTRLAAGEIDAESASAQLATLAKPSTSAFPAIVPADSFVATEIEDPPEVVRGVLHRGSKCVYGGPSKAFKSWALLDLCLSVANGAPWLGFETIPGPVLYVNLELQPFAVRRRLKALSSARRLPIPSTLRLWNLRGNNRPLPELLKELMRQIAGEQYALIVPDPVYKTLAGRDENSAGDIGQVCAELEAVAVQTGAALAFGAHFAKGNAAGKEAQDRISGSGVFARDPDSIIVATPHEEEGAFTVDMILRNFAPPDPFVMRWNYPLMMRDAELDPARLLKPRNMRTADRPEVDTLVPQATELVSRGPMKTGMFRAKLQRIAGTQSRARELFAALIADAHLAQYEVRGRGQHDTWIGTPAQIEQLRKTKTA